MERSLFANFSLLILWCVTRLQSSACCHPFNSLSHSHGDESADFFFQLAVKEYINIKLNGHLTSRYLRIQVQIYYKHIFYFWSWSNPQTLREIHVYLFIFTVCGGVALLICRRKCWFGGTAPMRSLYFMQLLTHLNLCFPCGVTRTADSVAWAGDR